MDATRRFLCSTLGAGGNGGQAATEGGVRGETKAEGQTRPASDLDAASGRDSDVLLPLLAASGGAVSRRRQHHVRCRVTPGQLSRATTAPENQEGSDGLPF